ncbi:hypothetical protein RCL1_004965 [Eukaryota sp. TZLM3-RCL]
MKLHYYACRGHADKVRLFLTELNVAYDDVIIGPKDSLQHLPFAMLPLLEDGDVNIVGDSSILRYLARKYDAYGNNSSEAADVDMWAEVSDRIQQDLWNAPFMEPSLSDLQVSEQKVQWLQSKSAELYTLAMRVSMLRTFFLVGGKLSFADLCLFAFLDSLHREVPLALLQYPPLEKYHSFFSQRPSVKKLTVSGRRY